MSNGVVFGTRKFHDANPKLIAAFIRALDDATKLVRSDPKQAAELYLAATKEKISVDELTKVITAPDLVYGVEPQNTQKIADHLFRSGVIKQQPKRWQDIVFADIHDRPGT